MLPTERQFRRSSEKINVESAAQATAELASKAGEERQARDTAAEATESEDRRLNLETAQKAGEERLHALPFSARMSHSSRRLQHCATGSITEAILEEAFARGKES